MHQYSEQDLLTALSDSREWGVPFNTLRSRIQGSESHVIAAKSQQRLSKTQEEHLNAWVLGQQVLGVPLTNGQIRQFATRVLKLRGAHLELGKR